MRSVRPYLPALLALLVPLIFLFWLGGRELSRLDRRADSILQNEASAFLQIADRRIQNILKEKASRRLEDLVNLDDRTLVEAARELSVDAWALDLFLLDSKGQLVFPRLPRFTRPSVPLRTMPQTGDDEADQVFLLAAFLESLGDLDGARQQLTALVERLEGQRRPSQLTMRSLFALAGLQAKAGNADAQYNYQRAGVQAQRLAARRGASAAAEDAAAILLLHEVGRAQIANEPVALLEILRAISIGVNDACDDVFLDAVFQRVAAAIPDDAPEHAAVAGARQDNEVRKAGRRFARLYIDHAAESTAKMLAEAQSAKLTGPFFQVLATPQGSSMLAIRRADMAEQLALEVSWVGVRLDFAALLNEEVMASIVAPEGYFSLAILDPRGTAILPAQPRLPVDFPVSLAPKESVAGLRLLAIPVNNPEAGVRAAEQNRLYLVLALIGVAAGGAIFLMRTVSRESELAGVKVQLVSRVSHELKTPLAVIKMYGDTLELGRTKGQEQVRRFAGIISREADRLSSMIEQILDFSRKESGTLHYATELTDLSNLILDLADKYRPHVESRGACLATVLKPGLHAVVDPQALTNAFVNLVENAVKYTPENAPDRTVEVCLSQSNGAAVLDVGDRGVGIPERERSEVFSPFYRASTAGEVHGAGLGLTLVQHFAQSHGGSIEVLPRPEGGTIMRMRLPLATQGSQNSKSSSSHAND